MRHISGGLIFAFCLTIQTSAQFNGGLDSLSYQGVLTDASGDPVPDASYAMQFALHDAAVNGNEVWSEVRIGADAVETVNGVYYVTLGKITTLSDVAFDKPLWLGITVGGDAEMTPRTPLSSSPYALSLRNLRVEIPPANATFGASPNLVGGYAGNEVSGVGVTVGGGGTDSGAHPNSENAAYSFYGVVAGGLNNTAGKLGQHPSISNFATVGGGYNNTADGNGAVVSGGENNTAEHAATVPGGKYNRAIGIASFAAGYRANANHEGTFVWNSRFNENEFTSTGNRQFLINASGGVGIGTNEPLNFAQLHVEHNFTRDDDRWGIVITNPFATNHRVGMRLSDFGFFEVTNNADDPSPAYAQLNSTGNWTAVSDRRIKSDIEPASGLLDAALALEPVMYHLRNQEEHDEKILGMIAQDVQRVAPSLVNEGDLLTLNYSGLGVIAIGALQEQHKLILDQQEQIKNQEAEMAKLKANLDRLENLVKDVIGAE